MSSYDITYTIFSTMTALKYFVNYNMYLVDMLINERLLNLYIIQILNYNKIIVIKNLFCVKILVIPIINAILLNTKNKML